MAPDYAGRGQSGRSRDISRYAPEACLRDVLDICAALHLHQAIAIGTSFGGLLSMGLAVGAPVAVPRGRAERCRAGSWPARVPNSFDSSSATTSRFADIDAAVAHLRAVLPPLSLDGDAAWRAMAALTYAPDGDGMLRPVWDTRIARLMNGKTPDLWALFGGAGASAAAAGARRGQRHPAARDTVARMQAMRPDMAVVSLPGIGHAPTLAEPEIHGAPAVPGPGAMTFDDVALLPASTMGT